MKAPEGFYVIYQPKYRVPSVFDLHNRGMFGTRPSVTKDWGYRIVADEGLSVKLQYFCLVEKSASDPKTGERFNFVVEKVLADLDETLVLKPQDFSTQVPDQSITNEIMTSLDEWRQGYIPVNEEKEVDREKLRKKLLASIADCKETIRRNLVRKNSSWVDAAIPRLIQSFRYGLYLRVDDRLFDSYREMGGDGSEKDLIRKIMTFYRIYKGDGQDLMRKPDGEIWKDEDEIWECWIGFAGSEDEAVRVCRTMESVFRPLSVETAAL